MGLFTEALRTTRYDQKLLESGADKAIEGWDDLGVRPPQDGPLPNFVFPEPLAREFIRIQEQIEYSANSVNAADVGRLVALVSADPHGSSTFIAYHLAMLYARGSNGHPTAPPNRRVLVIDTNPHEPVLHEQFGVSREQGLTEIIEDGLDFRQTIKFPYSIPLAVISAGRRTRSTPDLFSSSRFSELLWQTRQAFTHVFLDFAPLSEHSDSLWVAPGTNGIIMVVRTGKTPLEAVLRAKELLEQNNAPILGVVMDGKV